MISSLERDIGAPFPASLWESQDSAEQGKMLSSLLREKITRDVALGRQHPKYFGGLALSNQLRDGEIIISLSQVLIS